MGQVRLRLYLCLVLLATKHPFLQRRRFNLAYAQLVDAEKASGPRRVREALRWLEANDLNRCGQSPVGDTIEMLFPDGSGAEWPDRFINRFISIPLELWSNGWIVRLSARALAGYFLITELTAGRIDPMATGCPGMGYSNMGCRTTFGRERSRNLKVSDLLEQTASVTATSGRKFVSENGTCRFRML